MNTEMQPLEYDAATQPVVRKLTMKVFGIGGAGGNAVDYMARQELSGVQFMAINTDNQALGRLGLRDRMALGLRRTRGLGTGGDPLVGRAAAEEDVEKLRTLCADTDIICLLAGMGGGTGTGAAPVVARIARECGALVVGIVTTPFEFEGVRRNHQAQKGLVELKAACDGVICLPNGKVEKMIDENTSVEEAFKITNEILTQGVRGIWRLLSQTGLINVDFNDLSAVLRDRHEECSLASVEASGEGRVAEIMEKLAANPFLEEGIVLAEAEAVLISIAGGADLKMGEVRRVMDQISRQCENAHIIMGAAIQESLNGKFSLTLVASRHDKSGHPGNKQHSKNLPINEAEIFYPPTPARPASSYVPPAPNLSPEKAQELLEAQNAEISGNKGKKKKTQASQLAFDLEVISKGRFESSEPTIDGGEDLDVPTYIRRGVSLK